MQKEMVVDIKKQNIEEMGNSLMSKISYSLRIKQLLEEDGNAEPHEISPSQVKDIFRKISEEDARMLGFNYPEIKPEYMILSEIPVPPISVRPSVMLPGSTTPSEDDITFALSNILKANTAIIGDVLTSLIIDIIRNIVVREVEKWIMILKCYKCIIVIIVIMNVLVWLVLYKRINVL